MSAKKNQKEKDGSMDFYSQENMKNARVSEWYDRVTSSLDKCPFCDLKDKYIISEKNGMVLTVNLFPYIDGHLMVIPRQHIEQITQFTSKEWSALRELLELGVYLIKEELGAQNTNILYREGGGSGVSLRHLHWHILPITSEFMQYQKTHFTWTFQRLEHSPLEMANRMKSCFKRLSRSKEIGFMRKACLLCDHSLCEVKTAALAVVGGEVIEESWNELLDTSDVRDKAGRENVRHAEEVLIENAFSRGLSLKDATLYVTRFPCERCAKLIKKVGFKKIFYMSEHFTSGNSAASFLKNSGIEVDQIKEEKVWGAN